MIYTTNSAKATQKLARDLAKKYKNGAIIALSGPLGAGKTTFTQAFGQDLGILETIISPTFILIREHQIPNKKDGKLFHIDLYRLEKITDLTEIGLSEILSNPHNIILIEWAEKLGPKLPANTIYIEFKILTENSRQITVME